MIAVNLISVGDVAGTYKIIQAGSLTGGTGLTSSVGSLPVPVRHHLVTNVPNEISLTIRLKGEDELGINAVGKRHPQRGARRRRFRRGDCRRVARHRRQRTLQDTLQQMLPEHAGGAFENVTKGSRLMTRFLLDPRAPGSDAGPWRLWTEQVAWAHSKSIGATSDYNLGGWGAARASRPASATWAESAFRWPI